MTARTETQPKLSLLTAFDDLCRFNNSFIENTFDENEYIQLIRNFEENRIRWLSAHRDLVSMTDKYNELLQTNKTQEVTIKHLRYSLAKEVQTKDEFRRERDALRQQLDAIRKFVLEEPTTPSQNQNTRQKMLSYLNLHRLDTLVENSPSSDDSASNNDIEFDKTDEEVFERSKQHSFVAKRKSDHRVDGENVYTTNVYNDNVLSPKRNRVSGMGCAVTDDQMNGIEVEGDQEMFEASPQRNTQNGENKQQMEKNAMRGSARSHANLNTVPVLKDFVPFAASRSQLPKTVSQTSISNLIDNRMHSFILKLAIKPQKCDPCGKPLGFCGDCYKCRDCFAKCHIECRDKVPLPCIPLNRQNVKEDEVRHIAGYVAEGVRPAIPAQIVKLCNEIEKRGLDEEVLYRISGSVNDDDADADDAVNKLYRVLFVKPKKSLPSLSSFEMKVLCRVLKKFLMNLKEPIVTRTLWRDFVQAAEQKNVEDEQRLIKQAISELPTANRDTLAFLMVHLQRIAKAVKTKMDEKNIATVLGPTIIGHSAPNLLSTQKMAELLPQTKVMESLLRMSEDYWNSVVSSDRSVQTSPHVSPDIRLSIGTRLFSGTRVQRGILTPHRSAVTLNRRYRLKPLL